MFKRGMFAHFQEGVASATRESARPCPTKATGPAIWYHTTIYTNSVTKWNCQVSPIHQKLITKSEAKPGVNSRSVPSKTKTKLTTSHGINPRSSHWYLNFANIQPLDRSWPGIEWYVNNFFLHESSSDYNSHESAVFVVR